MALAVHLGYEKHRSDKIFRLSVRNFYGVLRVRDIPGDEENTAVRRLIHGTINHGTQLLDAAHRDEPTSYYGPFSGMGRAMGYLQKSWSGPGGRHRTGRRRHRQLLPRR